MKKVFTLLMGAVLAGAVAFAQPIPISSWNFNQSTSPSFLDFNVSASPVVLFGVNNIALQNACDATGYHGKDWTNDNTINLSQYYEFTVTPAAGYTIDLTRITFGYTRSQHGPTLGEVRSSLDNFTTAISSFNYQHQVNGPCFMQIIELGTNAFLDVSTSVTFRIYAYKAGSIQQARVLTIDDIVVNGLVIPGIALPVKLTSLMAFLSGSYVEIKWSTATEKNNHYFLIEKSTNGTEFENIGRVDGYGNSTSEKNYSIIDDNIDFDKAYYRLKQVDLDGKWSYSSILPVHIKKGTSLTNVKVISGSNKISVQHKASSDEDIEVSIVDMNGKKLESYKLPANKGNNFYDLSSGSLPAGIYILMVITEQEVIAQKFIK